MSRSTNNPPPMIAVIAMLVCAVVGGATITKWILAVFAYLVEQF